MLLTAGCFSQKLGGIVPTSQFVYPNSNVTPLGPTQSSKTKFCILIPPGWSIKDTRQVYNGALSKVPGANVLIDYKEDTTVSTYFFLFHTITYNLDGTAAKMEVGKQDIGK